MCSAASGELAFFRSGPVKNSGKDEGTGRASSTQEHTERF